MTTRCECGAAYPDGGSCSDRLYRLLLAKYREHEPQYRLAAACFALQHPHTHSPSCLKVARAQLEAALHTAGQVSPSACPIGRWLAARLAALGMRLPWRMTVASFADASPAGDEESLLAWAREVLEKSPGAARLGGRDPLRCPGAGAP